MRFRARTREPWLICGKGPKEKTDTDMSQEEEAYRTKDKIQISIVLVGAPIAALRSVAFRSQRWGRLDWLRERASSDDEAPSRFTHRRMAMAAAARVCYETRVLALLDEFAERASLFMSQSGWRLALGDTHIARERGRESSNPSIWDASLDGQ
jgi:hypothetical protein